MATTPKFESFIAIDDALQKRLVKTWVATSAPLVADLLATVADGDLLGAREVARGVTLDPVFDDNVGFITFMMTASILFGSSSVSSVEESMFVKGPLPEFFDVPRDQLEGMLKTAFAETVRRNIIAVIEAEENRLQDAEVVKAEVDFALAERMRQAAFGSGKSLINIGANLTTSRLVQFGALAEMRGRAMETYKLRAILDNRTSQICLRLNGRTFKVDRASDLLSTALGTQNPAELAGIHPWLPGNKNALRDYERLTNKQLNEKYGVLVPPFHPNCYDDKTRVMTDVGLILFADVDVAVHKFLSRCPDTGHLHWMRAIEKVAYPYVGELRTLTNKQGSVDMAVTPDHTMYFERRGGTGKDREWQYHFSTMEDFVGSLENKLVVATRQVEPGVSRIDVRGLTYKHRSAEVGGLAYDGMVYDVSLPELHTLLVERNGKLVWGSNCRTIVVRTGKAIPKAKFTTVQLIAPPAEPPIIPQAVDSPAFAPEFVEATTVAEAEAFSKKLGLRVVDPNSPSQVKGFQAGGFNRVTKSESARVQVFNEVNFEMVRLSRMAERPVEELTKNTIVGVAGDLKSSRGLASPFRRGLGKNAGMQLSAQPSETLVAARKARVDWSAANSGKRWTWNDNLTYDPLGIRSVVRHELGHVLTSREALARFRGLIRGLPADSLVRTKGWWQVAVSQGASINDLEAIAELFSTITSPDYVAGTLPAIFEDFVTTLLRTE